MAFRVVLDADVLVPVPLCDLLLRIAEKEIFDPLWSDQILREVEKTLIGTLKVSPPLAKRRLDAMQLAFNTAVVDASSVTALEPSMKNEKGDRHVLAAAVVSSADAIVTSNTRDFPDEACAPFGIEAIHPDDFLIMQLDLDPPAVVSALEEQAAALTNPPMTTGEVLGILRASVPRFVAAATPMISEAS